MTKLISRKFCDMTDKSWNFNTVEHTQNLRCSYHNDNVYRLGVPLRCVGLNFRYWKKSFAKFDIKFAGFHGVYWYEVAVRNWKKNSDHIARKRNFFYPHGPLVYADFWPKLFEILHHKCRNYTPFWEFGKYLKFVLSLQISKLRSENRVTRHYEINKTLWPKVEIWRRIDDFSGFLGFRKFLEIACEFCVIFGDFDLLKIAIFQWFLLI